MAGLTLALAQPEMKPRPVPAQAVMIVHADVVAISNERVKGVSAAEMPFLRYVWVSDGDIGSMTLRENVQASTFALATAGRCLVPTRPDPIAGGRVLRVNLRKYYPSERDLKECLETWEGFQFDPRFSLLVTQDTLKLLSGEDFNGTEVTVVKSVNVVDGKSARRGFRRMRMSAQDAIAAKDVLLLRFPAPHVDQKAYADLVTALNTQAPIVDYRYYIYRALSSIRDDGLYREIYGGLYYDLAGIRIEGEKGTDEDRLFERLGLGNIKGGVTAQKLFDDLKSDQRVAVFRSAISGRPRRVDWFRSPASRESTGLVMVTHDTRQKDVDISQHPILNLVDFKDAARELIYERADGTHGFALFDGSGKLQDEAPPDVVADRTVPDPHPARLQSAISCIRCHGMEGKSHGWQPLRNDVKLMLAKGLDVFGDVSERDKLIPDTVNRLAGWYSGSPERTLRFARDDYLAAVLRITGPWLNAPPSGAKIDVGEDDQTNVVRRASAKVASIYNRYYGMVGPQEFLVDLGFWVEESKAAEELRRLLPPVRIGGAIIPEDPRIGALKAGLDVNPVDRDFVYSFAAMRSQKVLKEAKK